MDYHIVSATNKKKYYNLVLHVECGLLKGMNFLTLLNKRLKVVFVGPQD